MPAHCFPIVRHLAKEMRSPGDHTGTQNIGNNCHDPRIGQHIPNSSMPKVCGADGIAVFTFREILCQEFVEVASQFSDFRIRKDPEWLQVTLAVESFDLFGSQYFGSWVRRCMK